MEDITRGGQFLVKETKCENVFTPEDFTEEQMLETFNYFDLQNFMPKVKCPVLYAVGLQDEFIAPGSAIAAYNKLPFDALSKSELFIFPDLGHEIPVYHNSFIGIWFNECCSGVLGFIFI